MVQETTVQPQHVLKNRAGQLANAPSYTPIEAEEQSMVGGEVFRKVCEGFLQYFYSMSYRHRQGSLSYLQSHNQTSAVEFLIKEM